jgi:four helix bundle protein
MEEWKADAVQRENLNRGCRELTVCEDAIAYYAAKRSLDLHLCCKESPSQQIASVGSIHRNIAEGYCRRSLNEYLQFLSFALASAGESVSGLHAFRAAKQITDVEFESLDAANYKPKKRSEAPDRKSPEEET